MLLFCGSHFSYKWTFFHLTCKYQSVGKSIYFAKRDLSRQGYGKLIQQTAEYDNNISRTQKEMDNNNSRFMRREARGHIASNRMVDD